jgi:hypothetical protein
VYKRSAKVARVKHERLTKILPTFVRRTRLFSKKCFLFFFAAKQRVLYKRQALFWASQPDGLPKIMLLMFISL